MSTKIQFDAKIAKHRRINIPKPLFQVKDGDQVRVTIELISEEVPA